MEGQIIAHDIEAKERTKDVMVEDNVGFDALLLSAPVLDGLRKNGFRKPSPIQLKAIPLGRCGFDLIVKSKSGTGKTLVFSVIALETLRQIDEKKKPQVLVLVPAREIAEQIVGVLRSIGSVHEGLNVETFIGGMPIDEDIKKAETCHIAVGTPGRIKHLIRDSHLDPTFVKLFVLDEADKLMEDSFQADINEIYASLPSRKQIIASSATFPSELDLFLAKYMRSPTHVSAELETPILLGLKQFVSTHKVSKTNPVQLMKVKTEALLDILSNVPFTQCLVFSNYQTRAESVSNALNAKNWNSNYISSAQSQPKRLEVMGELKEFKNRILLTTDLTARGIDAPNVDLVVNYDIPQDAVTYLHRMGRAGRYGAHGICINLACVGDELRQLQTILGAIGPALTMSKLSEFGIDWKNLDPTKFEQVNAIVSNEDKETIKQAMMELKGENEIGNKDKGRKGKKTSPNNTSKSKSPVAIVVEEENKVLTEAEELFASLLDDTKKRKRSPKKSPESSAKTFVKNNAMYTTAALLTKPDVEDEVQNANIVEALDQYLNILKAEDENDENVDMNSLKDAEESVANLAWVSCDKPSEFETETNTWYENLPEEIENIFKTAFDFTMDKEGAKHWMEVLPANELKRHQEALKSQQDYYNSFMDDDMEENCEEEEGEEEEEEYEEECEETYEESFPMNNEQYSDMSYSELVYDETNHAEQAMGQHNLQWVPVQQSQAAGNYEKHAQMFDNCAMHLWRSGSNFADVDEFDKWFWDNWRLQVANVRNYVLQNLYVQEMAQYQKRGFQ